jgi:hypothetical protein
MQAVQAVDTRTEPLLPTASASEDRADEKASKRGWSLYMLSLACCCFCHGFSWIFSPVVWLVTACKYWRKTPQERERFPKQRRVALTSLTTCLCASCCVSLVIVAALGFGAGFVIATQSKIAADLEGVARQCSNVTVYEKAACPDGFLRCERWPTQSERDNMCTDVANGTCEATVKERDVKDVFDLLCDDHKWAHIQNRMMHHHGRHHGHHGWHRVHLFKKLFKNPAILYVIKNRAIQYMKSWCPKHGTRRAFWHGKRRGRDHDHSNVNNYDDYYDDERTGPEQKEKVREAGKGFAKSLFHNKGNDAGRKSEFQV